MLLATVYLPVLSCRCWRWRRRCRIAAPAACSSAPTTISPRTGGCSAGLFWHATSADAARELRTYGVTEALARRHDELTERVRARTVRAALLSAALEAVGWLVFALGVVGAIVVLVLRAAHGHVSPGSVVMAVTLMRRAQTQISRSTDSASSFNTATSAARQLLWLQDRAEAFGTAAAEASGIRATAPPRLRDGIRLDGLVFAYPKGDSDGEDGSGGVGERVLGPIDLVLPAGKTIALVGENGAGKTTLVKLLCGMYAPTEGRITVDGTDLQTLAVSAWRERVTVAFQDFQRLQFILAESVGLGDLPRLEDHDAVRTALTGAGSATLEAELPDGLLTRIGTASPADARSPAGSGSGWRSRAG